MTVDDFPPPASLDSARARFRRLFGGEPTHVARARGRVNLIGDHTDTSEGFVLPVPIRQAVVVAVREVPGGAGLDHPDPPDGWERYLEAVRASVADAGWRVPAHVGTIASDLPMGEGLASSAALCVALVRAFAALAAEQPSGREVARLAHEAESRHVGVACGVMDQLCAAHGAHGAHGDALLIDTRTLEAREVPLPPHVRLAVLPTGVRRELFESPYNQRRTEVEEAARRLGVRVLRDLDASVAGAAVERLPSPYRERARHVLSENARVLEAEAALRAGDVDRLGALMDASHASLRDDFEASGAELETITGLARAQPGCLGARLTGAGFGGSAVALLRAPGEEELVAGLARAYLDRTGTPIRPFLV